MIPRLWVEQRTKVRAPERRQHFNWDHTQGRRPGFTWINRVIVSVRLQKVPGHGTSKHSLSFGESGLVELVQLMRPVQGDHNTRQDS